MRQPVAAHKAQSEPVAVGVEVHVPALASVVRLGFGVHVGTQVAYAAGHVEIHGTAVGHAAIHFGHEVHVVYVGYEFLQGGGEVQRHRRQQAFGVALGHAYVELPQVASGILNVGKPLQQAVDLDP